jgi:DNA polymerase-3 subunit epsilon
MVDNPKPEMHAIVELMGHSRIAGKISEQVMFGTALLRVDVPKTSQRDGYTKFYAAGAIYCITPTSEEIAQAAAEKFNEAPIQPWILPTSPLLAAKIETYEADYDEDLSRAFDEDRELEDDWLDDEADAGFGLPDDFFHGPTDDDLDVSPQDDDPDFRDDKRDAAQGARQALEGHCVILDTETTGLNRDRDDEPVQIAVIDWDGNVLLDTLVKPSFPIPADSTRIHGITDEMVKDAPTFADIQDKFIEAIRGKHVVIYNADYDRGILSNVAKGDLLRIHAGVVSCAMNRYAQFYGDWNDYHGSYRWQSLINACGQQGIEVTGEHSALGDCKLTLALMRKMAEFKPDVKVEAKPDAEPDLPF